MIMALNWVDEGEEVAENIGGSGEYRSLERSDGAAAPRAAFLLPS